MFDVCAEVLDLPLEEKMKFEQGDNGDSFGSVTLSYLHKYIYSATNTDTKPAAL